jgi:activator of Hsp90 ATPase-like protein
VGPPGRRRASGEDPRVTFEIEPVKDVVRLTVTRDEFEPGAEMFKSIQEGWPKVLSSLKSLLETGRPLPRLW